MDNFEKTIASDPTHTWTSFSFLLLKYFMKNTFNHIKKTNETWDNNKCWDKNTQLTFY